MKYLIIVLSFCFICPLHAETTWREDLKTARMHEKNKEYKEALVYLFSAKSKLPDSGFLNAYIGQMYNVRMNDYLNSIPFYMKSYKSGYRKRWQHVQTIKANFLAGNYYFGEREFDKAVRHFDRADYLLDFVEMKDWYKAKVRQMKKWARLRKKIGSVSPSYTHKIMVVFISDTDISVKTPKEFNIKSSITDIQKRETIMSLKSMRSMWEAWSGGKLSLSYEIYDYKGKIETVKKVGKGIDSKGRPGWTLNLPEINRKFEKLLLSKKNSVDTYLFIWSTVKSMLANGNASKYTLISTGKKMKRGFVQIPAERMVLTGPFIAIHEFFHVLEKLIGIKPIHGFEEKNRHFFPDWKGDHQYEYYQWHFKNTVPSRTAKTGYNIFSFVKRWPVE